MATFQAGKYNVKNVPTDVILIIIKRTEHFVKIEQISSFHKCSQKINKTELEEEYFYPPPGHPTRLTKLYAKDLIKLN